MERSRLLHDKDVALVLALDEDPPDTGPIDAGGAGSPIGVDFERVYRTHADFVWRSLQRLGVARGDLDDIFQDVCEIVQRRLASYRGLGTLESWLYGICLRRVKRYRYQRWFRREPVELAAPATNQDSPERELRLRERLAVLERALSRLAPEQRAVFTMCEIETYTAEEVSASLGIPLGTVYSRLRAARRKFQAECLRLARRGQLTEVGP
jgi:RNA polymerase sigma-70 factor, ECF subfamily